jgi:hypothetical protein
MRIMAVAATLLGVAALQGCTMEGRHEARAAAEAGLAEALAGYSPGATTSCVNSRDLEGNRSFGEQAILFDGTGDRQYLNRPNNCPTLGYGRALRVRSVSTRLCRGDIADVIDLSSRVSYGGCSLGDFTEYTRAR